MPNKVIRSYIVGDEWIYYKIYCGIKTIDKILIHHLKDLIITMIEDLIIDKWHFIRYSDPEHHLRLRLHLINKVNFAMLIDEINKKLKPLFELDLIWKIQLDTYNRKLERYGYSTIELSESLFFYDSELITNSIIFIAESQNKNLIWLFGLLIMAMV